MRHRGARQDDPPIVALEVGESDVVQVSVGPEDAIGEVIDRQGVWPGDVVLPRQNSSEVATVHAHLTYVRLEYKSRITLNLRSFAYNAIIREKLNARST